MSEVTSRHSGPRGRGSGRSGRGGFSRGGRGGTRQTNGANPEISEQPSVEDEGEIGELKSLYSSQLSTIKEMFPTWTDEDIVFALQETGGDLESTVDRMASGESQHNVLDHAIHAYFMDQEIRLNGAKSKRRQKSALSQSLRKRL